MTDTDEDMEFFDISDDEMVDMTPATADYDPRADQLRQEAEYQMQLMAAAHQQQLELVRQQTEAALQEQQRAHRGEAEAALQGQQRAHRGDAEAALQEQRQAHIREAASVFNQVKQETERVLSKEFQERQNMENQDKRVSARIQAEKIREEILNVNLIHRIDQRQNPKQYHLK